MQVETRAGEVEDEFDLFDFMSSERAYSSLPRP